MIKSFFAKIYAYRVQKKIRKWSSNPIQAQEKVFQQLISGGKNTAFGIDHHFAEITGYEKFKKNVPVRDYEALRPYIDRSVGGEGDILWKGKPIYFCKTSGTTSGTKYIPITKESMPNHINAARNALLSYIAETGKADFVNGKMIFLQGSPKLEEKNGIPIGRLSGIVAHHVPGYLQKNRMPSHVTNCIEDWETKVEKIVEETLAEKMTLISGIPSWVQMYFEKLMQQSGKAQIKNIFPEFSLFVYGGVNYEPYRQRFEKLIGKSIASIELYPASEGFIAFQNSQKDEGLLLVLNDGIFYEFIPADEFFDENPTRISLQEVEAEVNYVIILNTNAGLWGYNIGDTVRFVSIDPYKIKVTGRIKHFISAFGEHVIGEEVEKAIEKAMSILPAEVVEFTVAPQTNPPKNELPYHEWWIEFATKPAAIEDFSKLIDHGLQQLNSYYRDLIVGKVLQPLKIIPVEKGGFDNMMRKRGKLGGQNKVPRLCNDRDLVSVLECDNGGV